MKKEVTINHTGIYLIVIILLLALCFLLCFVELIPVVKTIVNWCTILMLLSTLVLTGVFIKKLWQWLRPKKTLVVTRWIVVSSGSLTYGAVLYFVGVILIIMSLSDHYMSKVDCPKYNVSAYLYDSSFMWGSVTVKIQRGNSIFLEKVSSFSADNAKDVTLFHEANYISVRIKEDPRIIYLDQPPIKK